VNDHDVPGMGTVLISSFNSVHMSSI
jgi:hypothetical protein